MSFDVIVVGNAGVDTNVYLAGEEIDFSVEANFTRNIDCIGQAGGYASRGYAAMGLRTAFIGAVGSDVSGEWIRRVFSQQGIDTRGLFLDPAGTSRSVNIMYKDGHRKNFYDGKSHMTLEAPVEVARGIFEGAKLIHFNIPNWARELLPVARSSGAAIACDIQDVVDPSDPYRRDFILQSNFLFFSAANHADPDPIIAYFWSMNPDLEIIAGMGDEGCAVGAAHQIVHYPALSLDLPVIDTNGAGDSLAVGYLTARVMDGCLPKESALRGQLAARFCCAQNALSELLITRKLLSEYLAQENP